MATCPGRKLIRSRTVWLLCGQYFCLSYGWYFYITWLPTYLKESRGLEISTGALLAGLPLFLGGLRIVVLRHGLGARDEIDA